MSSDQFSMFGEAPEVNTPQKPCVFSFSKTIKGSSQKVFDQWLIPVFIEEWMFNKGVSGEQIISLKNTVRKGGDFDFAIKKNGKDIHYTGEYLELRIPSQLSFTWIKNKRQDRHSQIDVKFESEGDRTKIRFTMKLHPSLTSEKETIKSVWMGRCNALADRFS